MSAIVLNVLLSIVSCYRPKSCKSSCAPGNWACRVFSLFVSGQPKLIETLRPQDSILCDQIFATEEQALIHQAGHVCEWLRQSVVVHDESTWLRWSIARRRQTFWPHAVTLSPALTHFDR